MSEYYESKLVKSRVAKRWFFNGKGYSTKRNAYTAKAKKMMMEMVLGPMIEHSQECDYGEVHWNQLENDPRNGKVMTKEESREALDARFAVFFPHVDSFECDQECRVINQEYDQWGRCTCEGDFEFQSCKGAQKRWLDAKVNELMAAEVSV